MGDMTQKTETVNGTVKVTSYAYKNHLLTDETTDGKSVSYTYDQNGNTLTKTADGTVTQYTYSPRNELLTVTEGDNTYSYTYNAAGLRTGKTSGGKTTEYIWSGDNIVREEETGKSIDYLYGINRVSRTIKGDNYRGTYYERNSREEITVDGYSEYYFCDGRGNVMQMVSSDYSGGITQIAFGVDASKMPELKIAEVYDDGDRDINSTDIQTYVLNAPITRSYYYDPYGGHWNEDNGYDTNPFRYAGEQWDRETGSIYLRARFYSPGTGRFMTVDPIKDGENWYVYCAGNPVAFRDPSGMSITLPGITSENDERFVALQNLTDDKLNFNGKYEISYEPNNNPEREISTNLVRDIIDNKNMDCEINIHNQPKGSTGYTYDSEGNVIETHVYFNPNHTPSQWSYVEGEGYGNRTKPAFMVLGHELVHVIRRMTGVERDRSDSGYYLGGPEPGSPLLRNGKPEELETTGIDYVKVVDGDWTNATRVEASTYYYSENALRLEYDSVHQNDTGYVKMGRRAAY